MLKEFILLNKLAVSQLRSFSKKGGSKILTVIYIFFICVLSGIVIVACKEDDELNNIVTNNDHFENDPDKIGSENSDNEELPDEEVDEDIADDDSDTLINEEAEEDFSDEGSADEEGQTDGEEIQNEEENSEQNGDEEIDYSSSDNFRIDVDLSVQKVFVYYKDKLIRGMICSGGTEEKSTPRGEYETNQKIEKSWVDKYNMGAYYWIRFYNEYLFHSVPYDKNGEFIQEEIDKLGTPASHGCIRLALEDAKWLYETLPLGVKVVIY